MPKVKTFQAGDPAAPAAPAMIQGGAVRVSNEAAESVGGVARIARAGLSSSPMMPEGGHIAAGMQQLGAGIKQYGEAQFRLQMAKAEAKNFADIHQAQLEAERVVGEFENWKTLNPNPAGWEKELRDRSSQFLADYGTGKNLSPDAHTEIKQRLTTYFSRQQIATAAESTRETVQRARQALSADYQRAVEAGDLQSAAGLAQYGFERGWIGEDQMVRMQFGAKDAIETKTRERLNTMKETALLRGDLAAAREIVNAMPMEPEEKALEIAILEKRDGYRVRMMQLEDSIASDPAAALASIDRGEWSDLRPSDRKQFAAVAAGAQIEEEKLTIAGMRADIDAGGVTLATLEARDDFRALSPAARADVIRYVQKGEIDDIEAYDTMRRKVLAYAPAEDPRGMQKHALETSISLQFGEQYGEELSSLLDERAKGQYSGLLEQAHSELESRISDKLKAGEFGGYLLRREDIVKVEDETGTRYMVADPNGDSSYSSFFRTIKAREIELSEDERLRYDSADVKDDDIFTDRRARARAWDEKISIEQRIRQKIATGEITDREQLEAEFFAAHRDKTASALERKLSIPRPAGISTTSPTPATAAEIDKFLNELGR